MSLQDLSALDIFKKHFSEAIHFIKSEYYLFGFFCALLVIQDTIHLNLQSSFLADSGSSQVAEIISQVLLVWTTVYFFHRINCLLQKRVVSHWAIFGESFLLLPGYILQSILWMLSFLVGICLLVVPGLYSAFAFYLAPGLSVLYPDYSGTTFKLSRELAHENFGATVLIVLVTSIIPFLPEGLLYFYTGTLKGPWSLYYSPIGSALYFFFELILFFFIYDKVIRHRNMGNAGAPSISS